MNTKYWEDWNEIFEEVMEEEKIFEIQNERRLYGFLFKHRKDREYVELSGRIPLALAEMISSDPLNRMDICVDGGPKNWKPIERAHHDLEKYPREDKIKELIKQGKKEELYVDYYQIWTVAGLKYTIKCIRKYKQINKWVIGNI